MELVCSQVNKVYNEDLDLASFLHPVAKSITKQVLLKFYFYGEDVSNKSVFCIINTKIRGILSKYKRRISPPIQNKLKNGLKINV